MFLDSPTDASGSEAGAGARSAPVGSAAAASRLVKRDEREPLGKLLASDERSAGKIDTDYESEIYKLESRGGRAATAWQHPSPRYGIRNEPGLRSE